MKPSSASSSLVALHAQKPLQYCSVSNLICCALMQGGVPQVDCSHLQEDRTCTRKESLSLGPIHTLQSLHPITDACTHSTSAGVNSLLVDKNGCGLTSTPPGACHHCVKCPRHPAESVSRPQLPYFYGRVLALGIHLKGITGV